MPKGSQFKRAIAKQLSLWWTEGERDDVIWRTQNSGGRATSRIRAGKTLKGQHGDLCATDLCAEPLFEQVVIETKRGYGQWSPLDLVDQIPLSEKQEAVGQTKSKPILAQWLAKLEEDRKAAGARWGILIAKRDQHSPVIILPQDLRYTLCSWIGSLDCEVHIKVRYAIPDSPFIWWDAIPLGPFLDWCSPRFFI